MIAIDEPNIYIATLGYGRSRLFSPFRYKQDDLAGGGGMLSGNEFIRDKTSTFDFEHSLFTMPYMK